ncbi:MAG: hypothetical protein JST50_01035 [Bacteroidetes bacterium]|jgi:Zn-dependent M32 family carboxypeptidase|nr:hypothetical protein [Bacteroidota bacterium]
MEILIEDNAVNLQKQTTHVIVEQKVMSFHEGVDDFLDKILDLKKQVKDLSINTTNFIEETIIYINSNENKETYIFIRELLFPIRQCIERLLTTIDESSPKFKECFIDFIEPFKVLLSDVEEIIDDLRYKIEGDSEMESLLK